MRHSHPNMFQAVVTRGLIAVVNGVLLAATDPRMPTWMPSDLIGTVFIVCGALAVLSALVSSHLHPRMVHVGKVAFVVLTATSSAMAYGLIQHFGTPTAVTQSIDRPIMYIAYALMCIATIREPPLNPITATGTD